MVLGAASPETAGVDDGLVPDTAGSSSPEEQADIKVLVSESQWLEQLPEYDCEKVLSLRSTWEFLPHQHCPLAHPFCALVRVDLPRFLKSYCIRHTSEKAWLKARTNIDNQKCKRRAGTSSRAGKKPQHAEATRLALTHEESGEIAC